jgi:hypothetical protein
MYVEVIVAVLLRVRALRLDNREVVARDPEVEGSGNAHIRNPNPVRLSRIERYDCARSAIDQDSIGGAQSSTCIQLSLKVLKNSAEIWVFSSSGSQ